MLISGGIMDFIDKIKDVGKRIEKLRDQVKTEEATKNAFIMPFIQALGYDVFNTLEVEPEYIADIGDKKGEKVDYAIKQEGAPIILIECKCCGEQLDKHGTQLFRYFSVTKARFAILTDGIVYRFFTDLEEPNKMDQKPFLEFNFLDIKANLVPELKKFCKENFDEEGIMTSAGELKYTKEIKNIICTDYEEPSEEFIRYFASKVHSGRLTQNALEKYTEIVQKAFKQFVNDKINERLESAIVKETPKKQEEEEPIEEETKQEVETTLEELEGFAIVKSVLRETIDSERISYKDTLSYFAINIDNNSRKTFCRLYLNTKNKYLGLIGEDKKEVKHPIESLNNIYNFTNELVEAVNLHIKEAVVAE